MRAKTSIHMDTLCMLLSVYHDTFKDQEITKDKDDIARHLDRVRNKEGMLQFKRSIIISEEIREMIEEYIEAPTVTPIPNIDPRP